MATQSPVAQFTTRQIAETEWLIYDTLFPADDSRHLVAHLATTEDLVEVAWVRPLPLPTQYLTVGDVVADIERWQAADSRRSSTRPILIPRLPPVG